ncbi:MAG: helix-turn-helix transcriptional regulator, partial [Actinomycetota bacterium]|nr:helix-turn-helix transcriptional regulator [Actinomycetota bacterium]
MRCRTCEPVPEEVRRAADLLERRWLLSVLYAALAGALRFNEFKQAVEGIPSRTLADRLRELERAGVLERRVIAARPPLIEYRLTEEGRRLAPVIEALQGFARTRPRPPAGT